MTMSFLLLCTLANYQKQIDHSPITSQIRAGVFPFPPQPKERLAEESSLADNLPGHNT